MKKESCIILFLVLVLGIIIHFMPFVSAYSYGSFGGFGNFDIRTGSEQIIRFVTNFVRPFFEVIIGDYSSGEFFLSKVLILILLFAVINSVIRKVPTFKDNRFVVFIISLVISVLSIRYMSETELINGILLPYGALGASIIVFLPLMIYFFFVEGNLNGSFGRRAAWILYGIIFLVLWVARQPEISGIVNWIYLFGVLFVLLCLLFDSSIHGYFDTLPLRRGMEAHRTTQKAKDWKKYKELLEYYDATGDPKALIQIKALARKFKGLEHH